MKKLLLLLLTGLGLSLSTSATHLMGGQITLQQLSGLDYLVTVTEFRDTTGIPMYSTITLNYTDNVSAWTLSHTVPHNGAVPFLNGVEYYVYTDTVTFPGSGLFSVSTVDCCRNTAILNMADPGGESFYLMTEVTVDSATANSTPVFLNPPVTLAQKNSLFTYNPLPYDADGDSLHWSLETPLGASGGTVVGYFLPTAVAGNPFTLDTVTGEISWMPDSDGHWEASFRVEEFRNGIKIGEIRRDMQYIVVDDTTNYFRMNFNTSGWATDSLGNYSMILPPNQPFYLTLTATQGDADPMDMQVNGEPFILASNPAQFNLTTNTTGYISGTVNWTPNASQVRQQPYTMAVRGFEYHNNHVFINDQTIQLRVGSAIGIQEIGSVKAGAVYPNPATQQWYLPFHMDKASFVKVEVLDLTGRCVETLLQQDMPAGNHLLSNQVGRLASGMYLVRITADGYQSTRQLQVR